MRQTWRCNGDDKRMMPQWLWEKDLSILSDEEEMEKALFAWRKVENRKEIILPLVQNLEGAVLGADVIKRGNYWTTGDYPFSTLEEINPAELILMKDKRMRTVIEVIKKLKEEPLILEVEAPFSILAALIDPMKLYLAMQTEPEKLEKILKKIVLEEAEYIKAVIQAGGRIISLAEPTGTIDMVGEKCFKECSGMAVFMLLKEIEKFLSNSVVHLCGKLSSSMLTVHMAEETEYFVSGETYLENLIEVTKNPEIHFVGQHCIHQKKNKSGKIYVITI